MLPRGQRLRARKDFEQLWKRGRSVYGRTLGIRFARNPGGQSRFGAVVGVKISKRATKRNRARRRIVEALRREFVPHLRGHDIVVVGRAGILERSYQEIVEELGALFRRVKLL